MIISTNDYSLSLSLSLSVVLQDFELSDWRYQLALFDLNAVAYLVNIIKHFNGTPPSLPPSLPLSLFLLSLLLSPSSSLPPLSLSLSLFLFLLSVRPVLYSLPNPRNHSLLKR